MSALKEVRAAVGRQIESRDEPGVFGAIFKEGRRYCVRSADAVCEYDTAEQLAASWILVDYRQRYEALKVAAAEVVAELRGLDDAFEEAADLVAEKLGVK